MDENERKRKRELADESEIVDETIDQGLDAPAQSKRQRVQNDAPQDDAAKRQAKADTRRQKREKTKLKVERKRDKQEAKKARKDAADLEDLDEETADNVTSQADDNDDESDDANSNDQLDIDIDINDTQDKESVQPSIGQSSISTTPNVDSPIFDVSKNQSTASSASSVPPLADDTKPASKSSRPQASSKTQTQPKQTPQESKDKPAPTTASQEDLQARLRARIELLRSKRKADGPDGQPVQSRQDLLEVRRKKEQVRKAHKKDLRLKAKQEEERLNNERLRGSGSPLTTDIFTPLRSPAAQAVETNFNFGRIAFDDGQQADSSGGVIDIKRKGPQDARTALEHATKKAEHFKSLDADKQRDIADKDLWLNAKKRAHGERIRDDTSLLKKTLKRKDKAKQKSEKEWGERIDGVKKGQEARQKKREGNLAKRKEDKGAKKSKSKGPAKGKKKGRPGF